MDTPSTLAHIDPGQLIDKAGSAGAIVISMVTAFMLWRRARTERDTSLTQLELSERQVGIEDRAAAYKALTALVELLREEIKSIKGDLRAERELREELRQDLIDQRAVTRDINQAVGDLRAEINRLGYGVARG